MQFLNSIWRRIMRRSTTEQQPLTPNFYVQGYDNYRANYRPPAPRFYTYTQSPPPTEATTEQCPLTTGFYDDYQLPPPTEATTDNEQERSQSPSRLLQPSLYDRKFRFSTIPDENTTWCRIIYPPDDPNPSPKFACIYSGYWHGPPTAPYLNKDYMRVLQPLVDPERDLRDLRDVIAAEPQSDLNIELLVAIDALIERPPSPPRFAAFTGYWHGPSNPYMDMWQQQPEPPLEPEPVLVRPRDTTPDNNQYRIMARCIKIKSELLEFYAQKTMNPQHLQGLLDNPDADVDEFMGAYVDGL